jgi:hypothetical protein
MNHVRILVIYLFLTAWVTHSQINFSVIVPFSGLGPLHYKKNINNIKERIKICNNKKPKFSAVIALTYIRI